MTRSEWRESIDILGLLLQLSGRFSSLFQWVFFQPSGMVSSSLGRTYCPQDLIQFLQSSGRFYSLFQWIFFQLSGIFSSILQWCRWSNPTFWEVFFSFFMKNEKEILIRCIYLITLCSTGTVRFFSRFWSFLASCSTQFIFLLSNTYQTLICLIYWGLMH